MVDLFKKKFTSLILCYNYTKYFLRAGQGHRKNVKLKGGVQHFKGTRALPEMRREHFCSLQNFGGMCPPVAPISQNSGAGKAEFLLSIC